MTGEMDSSTGTPRNRASRLVLSLLLAIALLSSGCESAAILPLATTQAVADQTPLAAPGSAPTLSILEPTATVPLSSPGPTSTASPPTAVPTPTSTLVDSPDFLGANAYQHLARLTVGIGSRPSGSAASRQAADYVQNELLAMGYTARAQSYSFNRFREGEVSLTFNADGPVEIQSRALVYSGGGTVEGNLVYCGLGRPADFPAAGLAGKIALVDRGGGLTFHVKAENAISRGAGAVVIVNDRAGDLRGALSRPVSVPTISILQVDGQSLKERLRRGQVAVAIEDRSSTSSIPGSNIVATLPSAGVSRGTVIVGAHYDSVADGPGANDNGSGISTLLEVARVARKQAYDFDLVFVAFGDEEVGLVGSSRYVESLTNAEKTRILGVVNLDMVGVGSQLQIGGDRALSGLAMQIARGLGYSPTALVLPEGVSSDHDSFRDAGIPAILLYRSDDPNYHSARDTAQFVDREKLETAGQVTLGLLDRLSQRQ